jgi:hypothetical protein
MRMIVYCLPTTAMLVIEKKEICVVSKGTSCSHSECDLNYFSICNELIMHKLESLGNIPYDISCQLITICTIQSERFCNKKMSNYKVI